MDNPTADCPAERTIEYVRLEDVAPATRNPKAHADNLLRSSIIRFGFTQPVLPDERTGLLVAGHGRLDALRHLHSVEAPIPDGITTDTDGHWMVPVVRGWASHDDAHAEAMIVADNQLTEAGGWDERLLAEVLDDLADYSPDLLAATGFTQSDLDHLIDDATGDGAGGETAGDPDELPDTLPDGPTVTTTGDVWVLGVHRLAVGDCRDTDLVGRLMDGKKAVCMWTDPPYGVSYVGKTADRLPVHNDGEQIAEEIFKAALFVAADHLRRGAPAYIAHAAGPMSVRFGQAIVDAGWSLRQQLLWVKDQFVMGRSDYHYRHEPIWLAYTPASAGSGRLGRSGERWYGDDSQDTVFEVPRPQKSDLHPTTKPVDLVTAMLTNSCPRGGIVLDLFAGSGTTLIACQVLGMSARVIELDAKYADVILRRWARLTGETPVREADGYALPADDAEAAA